MTHPLKGHEHQFALQRMALGSSLLSPGVAESLQRAYLACAEKQEEETGVIDLLCGLYLRFQDEIILQVKGAAESLGSKIY
jgi:hypothetical protein